MFTDRPGLTDLVECHLKLKDDRPFEQAAYRIPEAIKPDVERQLFQLLREGIIRESESNVSCPLVIVKKRDGSLQFCGNYNALNERLVDDHYISSNPVEIIANAGGAKHISMIDLRSEYWQIPLAEESRRLTVFTTPRKLYEWNVLKSDQNFLKG